MTVEPPQDPAEVPPRPDVPSLEARRRLGWPGKLLFLVPIVALALVAYLVHLPYFVLGPGPARDVVPLIHVQGHPVYPTRGHLLLTSVILYQPNVYQAVGAWISPSEAVVPERDILAPGETQQQQTHQAFSEMDTSKIDAAVVALTHYADYPKQHGSGVLVEDVFDGTPASGKLFAGDVILAVDGVRVDQRDAVARMIKSAGFGRVLDFTVQAGGRTRHVRLAPAHVQGVPYPAIGVSLVANFPFPLTIESGDIGGPSAGLMWTLGLIDLLTPGDLTHGRTIAGTGTIGLDGKVGPIGGIQEKVVGAEQAGATIFFAPTSEARGARSVAHGITVVAVGSYLDAVRYLEQHP